jgi:pyruvate/oxaloacetate carboxyltransferase
MTSRIQLNDVTLRDGNQSIAATRMTRPQALQVLKLISDAGFPTLELWGGAILDSCVRYLDEDPWERLETFAQVVGDNRKIMALLRGQNLFAYQPYPDDLVISFIQQAAQSGVGLFRVFDALNDERNLSIPMLACKASGIQIEAALSYTVSPVHTTEYFIQYAKKLRAMGADRIAIKDMDGILTPSAAVALIRGLKAEINLPLTLHSHTTTGMGLLNAVVGMLNGVDAIDTAITPFAGGSSHPPVELMQVFAEEMGLETGLDKGLILEAQKRLFAIFDELKSVIPYAGKYYQPVRFEDVDLHTVNEILGLAAQPTETNLEQAQEMCNQLMERLHYPAVNSRINTAQIPGGMLTNLQNQLRQMGREDLLDKLYDEIPVVRRDSGYAPLVTPTSQIIGAQATYNLITGQRYSFVSDEFRMLLRGEFGRTPVAPDENVVNLVLGMDEPRVKYRPASYLPPVLEEPIQLPFVHSHKDVLLHLMLGKAADDFMIQRDGKAVS